MAVYITGTGLDVLVLVMVACTIVVLDRLIGDYTADLLGSAVASIILAACLGAAGWVLFAKGGKADEFFIGAEQSGYRTLFYQPSGGADAPSPAPASDHHPTSESSGTSSEGRVAALPLSTSDTSPSPSVKEASAIVFESLGLERTQAVTPAIRLDAPEMTVTGSRVALRAQVTAGGQPVSGVEVMFSVNGRSLGTSSTDAKGVASMPFVPRAARTHEVHARSTRSSQLRESSARILVHVLPGRS